MGNWDVFGCTRGTSLDFVSTVDGIAEIMENPL